MIQLQVLLIQHFFKQLQEQCFGQVNKTRQGNRSMQDTAAIRNEHTKLHGSNL